MALIEPPYYPIVYVRGYAGKDSDIEDTVAEPYMGFNLGSTKFRQSWDGVVRRHYFESPVIRLAKDFGYTDVYSGGEEMPLDSDVGPRSIFIYRYYDEQYFDALMQHGGVAQTVSGEPRTIEEFAEGLGHLILRIRDRICGDDAQAKKMFKVHLVAHSMGGLVCRSFLQNEPTVPNDPGETKKRRKLASEARDLVDKVFTYATPHNGIEFKVVGNVPAYFSLNDVNNFNRNRMAAYLGFGKLPANGDVSNLQGKFPAERFFCLVGTNWQDYVEASGWSKRLTGPMSDGLVRIVHATVFSQKAPAGPSVEAPRAFVHRSHSGHFGIVNSEEGYQNLARFLFGDMRIDGVLEVKELTLPKEVQEARDAGNVVIASYHFEVVVRVRGFDWELHRRTVREESAIFRTFDDLSPKNPNPRHPHLFSVFLSTKAKVKKRRPSLGFAIDVGVLVPEYVIDKSWWRDQHYKGSYLYRDTITVEATPITDDDETGYKIRYGFDSSTPNRATRTAEVESENGKFVFRIPIESKTTPGLTGTLVLTARRWS